MDSDVVRAELPLVDAPSFLFRMHRAQYTALDLPDWQYANADAPGGGRNFGGRWDDPNPVPGERFRTLSLGNDPLGVSLEVLQSLEPDPEFALLVSSIADPDGLDARVRPSVTLSDLTARRLSTLELEEGTKFMDVTNSKVRSYLEAKLEPYLEERGIARLKIGDLLGADTELSQRVAEIVHDNFPDVAGITTPSALGTDFQNFYVFESEPESGQLRAGGRILESNILSAAMPEVRIALDELRLTVRVDGVPGLVVAPEAVRVGELEAQPGDRPPASMTPGKAVDRVGKRDRAIGLPPASLTGREFESGLVSAADALAAAERRVAPAIADLPVYRFEDGVAVSRREDFSPDLEQTMVILGRSEDAERVFGQNGTEILSVAAAAFSGPLRLGDEVMLARADGVDRGGVVDKELALDR